jgi:chromosome segregation ATPase
MSKLSASNIDAVAYHLEQGCDNGNISREALALQLRSVAQEMRNYILELSTQSTQLEELKRQWVEATSALEQVYDLHNSEIAKLRATVEALDAAIVQRTNECLALTNDLDSANACIRQYAEYTGVIDAGTARSFVAYAVAWLAAHLAPVAQKETSE